MKRPVIILLICIAIFSCKRHKGTPDVSKIKVDIQFERFDKDFFLIDSNNVLEGLNAIHNKYPLLTNFFLASVLGLDSNNTVAGTRQFLGMSGRLYDTVNIVFRNTTDLEKEFEKAFKFYKYYYPSNTVPAIATIVGPMDALAQSASGPTPNFLGPGILGISLQFYLGRSFSIYSDPYFIENVAPQYRSRRFSKEYIVADAMKLIVDDMYPDQSKGKPLIEQMVEKGKQWYLLDKFLPGTPDSIKTGYTAQQLAWCKANEGLIWTYIVKNEDLNSINPVVIQTYIGEGPFTQGFSQEESPGNMGQWVGWQIVKNFVAKQPKMKTQDV
jgi:hypothetical protein